MYWLCCHYYSLLIFQWGNIVFCHLWFNLLSSLFYFPYSFSLHWFLPHFLFCCEIQQQVIKWLLMCVISSFNILVPGVCFLSVTLVPPLCLSRAALLWKSSPGTMNCLQQSRHQTDSFMKLKHDINLEYWKWEKDRPALINYSQLLFKVESTKVVGSPSCWVSNVFTSLSSRPGRPPKRTLGVASMTEGSRLLPPHSLLSPTLLSQTGEWDKLLHRADESAGGNVASSALSFLL